MKIKNINNIKDEKGVYLKIVKNSALCNIMSIYRKCR